MGEVPRQQIVASVKCGGADMKRICSGPHREWAMGLQKSIPKEGNLIRRSQHQSFLKIAKASNYNVRIPALAFLFDER